MNKYLLEQELLRLFYSPDDAGTDGGAAATGDGQDAADAGADDGAGDAADDAGSSDGDPDEGEPADDAAGDDDGAGEDKAGEDDGITPETRAAAEALGYTKEFTQGLDEKTLKRMIDVDMRRLKALGQTTTPPGQTAPPASEPGKEPAAGSNAGKAPEKAAKPAGEAPTNPWLYPMKLNKDEVHEGFYNEFKGMNEHVAQVVSQLHEQLQALHTERAMERFERTLDNLAPEFHGILGKGSSFELDPKSPQAQARAELLDNMVVLAEGFQRRGQGVPSEKQLFKLALDMTCGDARVKAAERAAKLRRENGTGRFTRTATPPGSSHETTDTGEAAARELLQRKLRLVNRRT